MSDMGGGIRKGFCGTDKSLFRVYSSAQGNNWVLSNERERERLRVDSSFKRIAVSAMWILDCRKMKNGTD
jgi:hypothetical protein